MSAPSHALNVAFAVVPKIPSVLSILGSSLIVYDAAYRQLRLQDQPWPGLVPMLMDCLRRQRRRSAQGREGSAAGVTSRNSSTNAANRKGSYVAPANVRYHTYHRLLLSMSIFDVLSSCALFMSTWPIPADTPSKIVYGAVGNQATCSAQGFFVQFSMGTVLYNATLSVFYLLSIRFRWSPQRVAAKAEPWLHAVPVLFAVGTAIAGVPLGLYNYARFMCYVVAKPFKCQESWKHGDDPDFPCQRGDNATVYNWAFNILPKAAVLIIVTLIMWLCHRHVLRLERRFTKGPSSSDSSRHRRPSQSSRRSREYDDEDDDNDDENDDQRSIKDELRDDEAARPANTGKKGASMSKRIARQSFLYVGALYLTLLPGIVNRLTELIAGKRFAAVAMTIALLMPAQGFWNCFIYFRPRYLQVKRRQRRSREKEERERIVQAAMRTENGNSDDGGQLHPGQPNATLPPRGTTSGTVAVIQAVSAALFENDLETDDAEDEEEEQQRQQNDHARAVDGRCPSENAGTAMDTNFRGSSTQLMADAGLEMKNIPGIDR
mmetsp:Transcript_25725/g.60120  ORF Transcript_25725/g.60120 Transcript_25725/m.60120 type:complete len:547 (-) Transcript_25725:76-1716(-)